MDQKRNDRRPHGRYSGRPVKSSADVPGLVRQAFDIALSLHHQGKLEEAEGAYRQILSRYPDHAGALHYLGAIAMQMGQPAAGLPYMERAREISPSNPQLLTNLGQCYKVIGRYQEAADALKAALEVDPALVSAPAHLAGALAMLGEHAEALPYFETAIQEFRRNSDPELADYLSGMGQCLFALNDLAKAIPLLEEAVRLDPTISRAFTRLGIAYRTVCRYQESLESLLRAANITGLTLEIAVELIQTFSSIGDFKGAEDTYQLAVETLGESEALTVTASSMHLTKEEFKLALDCALKVLEQNPKSLPALVNASTAYRNLHFPDKAEQLLRRCMEYYPNSMETVANLASLLWTQGDAEAAIAYNNRAMEIDSTCPGAIFNMALFQLGEGNLVEGWKNYEYGIVAGNRRPQVLVRVPPWDGNLDRLDGKRIFVRGEQGIGDQIMFSSILPDLIARAGNVVVDVNRKLVPLFTRSFPQATILGVDEIAEREDILRICDYQIMMGSLPWRLRNRLEDFPNPNVILKADTQRSANFRSRLEKLPGKVKVAIAWRSKLMNEARAKYYMTLDELVPILSLPDTCFVSLQYDEDPGAIREEITGAEKRHGVNIHILDDLDTLNDLAGVADLVSACDCLISAPSTAARIGGGLGLPTFEVTPSYMEQHLGQNYSPFAPSIQIVRPKVSFDRPATLALLEEKMRDFVRSRTA